MSYESRAYDKPNTDGFGPDPVIVLVVEGTHDVSRFVNLLHGAPVNIEQMQLGQRITAQVRQDQGGRAALRLLAEHGGANFLRPSIRGLTEDTLVVLRRLAEGMAIKQIARELDVTSNAVTNRIYRACTATGARTREHLLSVCVQLGIVEPGPLQTGRGGDR